MFINGDFETWTGSTPTSWDLYNNKLLGSNVLTTSKNTSIFKTGTSSCKIDASIPCAGIQQAYTKRYSGETSISIYPTSGSAFVNFAKEDDSSALFDRFDEHWYGFTNSRGFHHITLRNGKKAKLFTLSNTSETGNTGQIYIKVENEIPRVVYNESGYQQLISCYYKFSTKEVILYHRIDSSGLVSVYLLESTDSFMTVSRNVKLITSSYETQAYSIIKMSNGMTIIPFQVYKNNRYELDILYSTDDLVTTKVTSFSKYGEGLSARGLMETKAYELNSTTTVLISRSESGYLVKNTFDTTNKTLSASSNTLLASTSTTLSLIKKNSKVIVAYSPTNKDKGASVDSNSPRGYIGIAVLNLDFDIVENMLILCTNNTFKGSFATSVPYCHSPLLFEIDGDLYVTVEYVTSSGIKSTTFVGSTDSVLTYNKSIATTLNAWNDLKVFYPKGANKIQIVSGYHKTSSFYVDSLSYSIYKLYARVNNKNVEIPYFDKINRNISKTIIKLNNKSIELPTDEKLQTNINNGSNYTLYINNNGINRKMFTIK
ncbi:hypothetical protein [Clostridium sp.]|uniref:hypothetical protein n=1 Tax=Clostridium sp. TaxID=1506 RepID=UPI0029062145|nr:hypothetical protein [Clostridium sp.]MDU3410112.1 hypothetical protein [Clostridium sp.]